MLMIRQLTLLGAGIGVMDQSAAAADVESGRLVPVLPAWQLRPVPVHLLTSSRLLPARVRLFGDLLGEMLPKTD
jgi:DNA-binding transcriptional LysR family regulator